MRFVIADLPFQQPAKGVSNPPALHHSGVSLAPGPTGVNSNNAFTTNSGPGGGGSNTMNNGASVTRQSTPGSHHKNSGTTGSTRSSGVGGGGDRIASSHHQQQQLQGTPGSRDSPSRQAPNSKIFIAMFDYSCQTDDDLPFK